MSLEAPPLTPGESDFLGQLCRFAESKAQNDVYLSYLISPDGAPVLVVIAIGEQAMALQQIVLGAQMPQSDAIELVSSLDDVKALPEW